MVLNDKGIPDIDPLDPDCMTCRVAAKAVRELNSGIPDCSQGQQCREGNPINPGAGVKYEQISLYRGVHPSPLNVEMQFLHIPGAAFTAPGYYWRNPYNGNVQILTDNGDTYARVVLPPYSPNQFNYFHKGGTAWVGDPGTKVTLTEIKNSSSILTGFKVVDANDTVYGYTLYTGSTTVALLTSITTHDGRTVAIANPSAGQTTMTDSFGHTVSFVANNAGMITSMTAPDGNITTLSWDTAGTKLLSIAWSDTKTRSFVYENTTWPNALTGIIDENGNRYATWTYDATGNATGSWHGDALQADKTTIAYNTDGSANVTDLLGGNRTYQFSMIYGIIKATGLSQPCTTCGINSAALTYDANGNIASRTDFNGNTTCYAHDLARNLETVRVEGLPAGTACPANLGSYAPSTAAGSVERKITTQWHAILRLPVAVAEPLRITGYSYDAQGNLQTKTLQPTNDATGSLGLSAAAAGTPRITDYAYNIAGQVLSVNGPRTDVADITSYDYDTQGNLVSVRNALSQFTTLGNYDANGRPGSITDPNGLVTYLSYDPRGRLTSRSAGGEITSYEYDGVGQLHTVATPGGAVYTYNYDAAHRLTDIADNLGNRIHYTLDAMGNRTKEEIFDSNNTLVQTHSRAFDALNRLYQDIGAVNQTTTYEYDANGNLTKIIVPFTRATIDRTTVNTYDALDRLNKVTNPDTGVIKYVYDGLDQLSSVTDPNNLATIYTRNGLGNLTQTKSPDTGTSNATYDEAGNTHTKTDAKGQIATYTYDALNRLTGISYTGGTAPAQTVSYQYDQGSNGTGHLTGITDVTGTTSYSYDQHGRQTGETKVIQGATYTTAYGYDIQGRLNSITYPSGRTVDYGFDGMGRINQIASTYNSTTKILANNIVYEPFGGVHSFTFGDGLTAPIQTYTRQRDQDGRIASYTLNGKAMSIGYDAASQISTISDPQNLANIANYYYDPMSRLNGYTHYTLSQGYSYDAGGNRASQTIGNTTTSYGYPTTSNRLASIQVGGGAPQAVTQDANGATKSDPTRQYGYDIRGRLIQATTAQGAINYAVNALGLRVRKQVPYASTDTLYHYDALGHLIGESPTGTTQFTREYVYLGDQPVAVIK